MEVNLHYDWDQQPATKPCIWWNNQQALRTRVLDALSIIIPCGEQTLITVLQAWLQAQTHHTCPPSLQSEVTHFIADETKHQRAHQLYNQNLAQHAPVVWHLEQKIKASLSTFDHAPLAERVAIAAAIEHITSIFSHEILRDKNPWLAVGTSKQRRMWVWHAREEIAHCHVTTQVLQTTPLKRFQYRLTLVACIVYIAIDMLICVKTLCASDIKNGRTNGWSLGFQCLGLGLKSLPSIVRMGWALFKKMP
jgi:uncharacterized protein